MESEDVVFQSSHESAGVRFGAVGVGRPHEERGVTGDVVQIDVRHPRKRALYVQGAVIGDLYVRVTSLWRKMIIN